MGVSKREPFVPLHASWYSSFDSDGNDDDDDGEKDNVVDVDDDDEGESDDDGVHINST